MKMAIQWASKQLFFTGDSSDGSLRLSIVHQPNKLGTNVRLKQMDYAGGKIVLETTFNLQISAPYYQYV
ncbi:MAG: hypothetical protein ACI9EQ_001147 [Bacteroidia bacterium]|jgi:hypothetical protein